MPSNPNPKYLNDFVLFVGRLIGIFLSAFLNGSALSRVGSACRAEMDGNKIWRNWELQPSDRYRCDIQPRAVINRVSILHCGADYKFANIMLDNMVNNLPLYVITALFFILDIRIIVLTFKIFKIIFQYQLYVSI